MAKLLLTATPPKKLALLVAINPYPGAPLQGCVADLKRTIDWLLKNGWKRSEIHLLIDKQATKARILKTLTALLSKQVDLFYFKFSGHGAQIAGYNSNMEIDGVDECLCPIDFDGTLDKALLDSTLQELLMASPIRKKIIDMDACFSGGMDERESSFKRAIRKIFGAKKHINRSFPLSFDNAHQLSAAKSLFVKKSRKLAANSLYLMAAQENQTAADAYINEWESYQGAFTWAALSTYDSKQAVGDWMNEIRLELKGDGFDQVPIVSTTNPEWLKKPLFEI